MHEYLAKAEALSLIGETDSAARLPDRHFQPV